SAHGETTSAEAPGPCKAAGMRSELEQLETDQPALIHGICQPSGRRSVGGTNSTALRWRMSADIRGVDSTRSASSANWVWADSGLMALHRFRPTRRSMQGSGQQRGDALCACDRRCLVRNGHSAALGATVPGSDDSQASDSLKRVAHRPGDCRYHASHLRVEPAGAAREPVPLCPSVFFLLPEGA